jgi:Ala-tRNA(Pro) deacylase
MSEEIHQRLVSLFQESGAAFRVVEHPAEGRTEVITRIRGNRIEQAAKALVVLVKQGKKSRRYLLCVVPGDARVDLAAVKALGSGTHAMMAPEAVAEELTGCAMGAVPPVSFNPALELVVDPRLLDSEEIVFNAGRLDRSIFIERSAYVSAARPTLAAIAARSG